VGRGGITMSHLLFDESEILVRKTITADEISDNQRKYGRLQIGKDILSQVDENTVIEVIVRTA
jgi:hypothetical protein